MRRGSRPDNKLAFGYIRYSTEKQGDGSIARQCAAIERWAQRTEHELVAIMFDFEVSRKTATESREGLALVALEGRKQRIGVVVAETVSRYVASPAALEEMQRELKRRGMRMDTADGCGNQELDETRWDFEALMSKYELKYLSRRTRDTLAAKKAKGEVVGTVPYGYRKASNGHHSGNERRCQADCAGCRHIEPDPTEQYVMAKVRKLYGSGLGVKRIVLELARLRLLSRSGGDFFPVQIRRMLSCQELS